MPLPVNYDDNVFINCPFDDTYDPIFYAIVFTVHDAGFGARCAKEQSDSGEVRIVKIMRIIGECRYGIHDISYTELDPGVNLPRFNMPYELGLFLGCQHFGKKHHQDKYCLVLDREKYRYEKFLSDIKGQDISSHNGKPEDAVKQIRKWLATTSKHPRIPSSDKIWTRFQQFDADLPILCQADNKNPSELTFPEYQDILTDWLIANPI